jgi:hypothetical protein
MAPTYPLLIIQVDIWKSFQFMDLLDLVLLSLNPSRTLVKPYKLYLGTPVSQNYFFVSIVLGVRVMSAVLCDDGTVRVTKRRVNREQTGGSIVMGTVAR